MFDLARMRQLNARYLDLYFRVEQAEANATRITSNITGMPRGGSGNRQEDAMVNYVDVKDAYRTVLAELDCMRAQLSPALDRLPEEEAGIMRLRYMYGHTIGEITRMRGMSRATVYRYLKQAEGKVVQIIETL